MKQTLNLQKISSALIIIGVFIYVSIVAKSIIIPFIFAGLFAFLLKPICDKLEHLIPNREIASAFSFIVVLLPLFVLVALFSVQFFSVFENLPAIGKTLEQGFNFLFSWFNEKIDFTNSSSQEWIEENSSNWINAPINFISQSISSSTSFFANTMLCLLYTYFLLLYRSSFKKFIVFQFHEDKRNKVNKTFAIIQKVIQQYLYGMGVVILVLGFANSLGLFLIGIDYAIFWGFLAAFLAIIPYLGTLVGGFLPFLFALMTTGNFIQPALVVILFTVVQALEGNIITPKIVGSSVKINPLAAILSLVIGGFLWGIAGLILALPTIAVIRIIMSQIDYLKPVSVLLSDDVYGNEEVFEEKYNSEKFRFGNFFRRKKQH